jgi:hypothetical protein
VAAGDSLSAIGTHLGTSWQSIFAANRSVISNPDLIYAGQRLRIPVSGAGAGQGSVAGSVDPGGPMPPPPRAGQVPTWTPQPPQWRPLPMMPYATPGDPTAYPAPTSTTPMPTPRALAAEPAPNSGRSSTDVGPTLAPISAASFGPAPAAAATPTPPADGPPAVPSTPPDAPVDGPPAVPGPPPDTQAPNTTWALPTNVQQAVKKAGLPISDHEMLKVHHHAHLDIQVDGQTVTVPEHIGIDEAHNALSPLHTHDTSGIIHIESPDGRKYTLGQLFTEWGQPLSRDQIGQVRVPPGEELRVYVNGKLVPGDPANLVFHQHDEIALWVGPQGAPYQPPASYRFPPMGDTKPGGDSAKPAHRSKLPIFLAAGGVAAVALGALAVAKMRR